MEAIIKTLSDDFTFQKVDKLSFDVDDLVFWRAATQNQFDEIKDKIQSWEIKTPYYTVCFSCDNSNFEWMQTQKDDNYCLINLTFNNVSPEVVNVDDLRTDLQKAYDFRFYNIEN